MAADTLRAAEQSRAEQSRAEQRRARWAVRTCKSARNEFVKSAEVASIVSSKPSINFCSEEEEEVVDAAEEAEAEAEAEAESPAVTRPSLAFISALYLAA